MDDVSAQSAPMLVLLQAETDFFLGSLADDATRLATLQAKLKAIEQTYTYAPFTEHLHSDYQGGLIGEGFRKWEDHVEIQSLITWLQEKAIDTDVPLSDQEYETLKQAAKEELIRLFYSKSAADYLYTRIWTIEGRIALARDCKADTGLQWNLTSKPPFTQTDFENLMSALWEKKFFTHASGRKELAIKALYGVFNLPAPGKVGTNRHKAKSAGTTSHHSFEIFDRLKAAHQHYLDDGME
jgi:hypothetical protein